MDHVRSREGGDGTMSKVTPKYSTKEKIKQVPRKEYGKYGRHVKINLSMRDGGGEDDDLE